jgi:hypothetical protein
MASARSGAELLDALHAALSRYVVFPSEQAAHAATLWIAATHAQPAWEHAPRLAAISAVKRSGKSRLMDVIAETCHSPIITFNATIAAIVRSIDSDDPPALLVDEADALFGSRKSAEQNEDLRGLLNSGHQRNRPLLRWDMTSRSLDELPTFAMAMLASIGDLPATVMDRAVVLRMRRRAPGEKIEPWRTRRDAPPLNELRGQLHKWVRAHLRQLRVATPDTPLEDRAADTWEPLIAIADLAGDAWPVRARIAAEDLTRDEADAEADASAGVRLLEDAYAVFEDAAALHSKTLLDRLLELEGSPWADWARGRGLNQQGLAKLLRPFGIKPCNVRQHGTDPPRKGYRVEQFDDAWRRYTPHLRPTLATAATSVTSQLNAHMAGATDPLQAATDSGDVAARSGYVAAGEFAVTSDVTDVAAVADGMREAGEEWSDADDAAWQAGQLPGVDPGDDRRFTR